MDRRGACYLRVLETGERDLRLDDLRRAARAQVLRAEDDLQHPDRIFRHAPVFIYGTGAGDLLHEEEKGKSDPGASGRELLPGREIAEYENGLLPSWPPL